MRKKITNKGIEESSLGIGKSECKGPRAGKSFMLSQNLGTARMPGAE